MSPRWKSGYTESKTSQNQFTMDKISHQKELFYVLSINVSLCLNPSMSIVLGNNFKLLTMIFYYSWLLSQFHLRFPVISKYMKVWASREIIYERFNRELGTCASYGLSSPNHLEYHHSSLILSQILFVCWLHSFKFFYVVCVTGWKEDPERETMLRMFIKEHPQD